MREVMSAHCSQDQHYTPVKTQDERENWFSIDCSWLEKKGKNKENYVITTEMYSRNYTGTHRLNLTTATTHLVS